MRKVLAIDGGGIKGVIPATFLAEIEEKIGTQVRSYFDLIVGTSTGGLIALALGLDIPAKDILQFYENWGPTIFPEDQFKRGFWGQILSPKYDINVLNQAVKETFGEWKLGHSKTRLVIPSFDVSAGRVQLWKTSHHPNYEFDCTRPAVDVALSTAAAPGYFQTYQSPSGEFLVDGGIWANCPVLVAAIEAVYILKWDPSDVAILSLGCSQSPLDVGKNKYQATGLLQWAFKLPELVLYAQRESALGMARLICPDITRIDPLAPEGLFALDNVAKISEMKGIAIQEAKRKLKNLREKFFSEPAEPFVPYRKVS